MEKLNNIPIFLQEKLEKQYGKELTQNIIEGYFSNKKVTLRVNTLKSNKKEIIDIFNDKKIEYDEVDWFENAFIIKNKKEADLQGLDIYKEGKIYLQSLSSMLPPLILNPIENLDILDMCAAPGGKTAEIAALTNNKTNITACEMNKIRFERLKYNMEKQGVRNINLMRKDSRFLNDFFSFDKILLDAPCSGSGTINLNDENTYKNFSLELINKSCELQIALLRKAINVLKKGQEIVYSTCSILEEENENIVEKIIKENNLEVVPINIKNIPLLPSKISGSLCVMPTELYEGFFVVKLKKM